MGAMKKIICLFSVAILLLPSCFDDRFFGQAWLVVLFTDDTLGEIEPCG